MKKSVFGLFTVLASIAAQGALGQDNPRWILCRGNGECGDVELSHQVPRQEMEGLIGEPPTTVGPEPYVLCLGSRRCSWTSVPPSDIEIVLGGDGEVPVIHNSADPGNRMDFSGAEDPPEGMEFTDEEAAEHDSESEDRAAESMEFTEAQAAEHGLDRAVAKLCGKDQSLCDFKPMEFADLLLNEETLPAAEVVPSGLWIVHNRPTVMHCTGMTVPVRGSKDKGRFEPIDGGRSLRVVGLTEDSEVVLNRRRPGIYGARVQVTHRVPVAMTFLLRMTSSTTFRGVLTSAVSQTVRGRLMNCSMFRLFEGELK